MGMNTLVAPSAGRHRQHNLESSQRLASPSALDSAYTLGSSALTPPRYSLLYVHLFLCCTCASGMHSWHAY